MRIKCLHHFELERVGSNARSELARWTAEKAVLAKKAAAPTAQGAHA